MTTKERERDALARIASIVAELGPDSYIGTALEGCLEIAADNIENDFACSMMQRWQSTASNLQQAQETTINLRAELKTATARAERLQRHLDESTLKGEELREALYKERELTKQLTGETEVLRDATEHQASELVRLKAKLYDLLVKD